MLDAIRREARKPLVATVVRPLEELVEAHDALLAFDRQWDAYRGAGHGVPALCRTPMTTVTSGEVERVKDILLEQGWL